MEKSKTRQDMAKEYGVDRKTFYLMLKRMNVSIPPGLILPRFQELIYFHLDKPKKSFFATVGLPLPTPLLCLLTSNNL